MPVRSLRLVDTETPDFSPAQGGAAMTDAPTLDRRPLKGGTMKVAFTTNDLKMVNAHFAGAKTIAVYEVGQDDYKFLEALQFSQASQEEGKHGDDGEERISARIRALEGCALLFVKAIGGPAAAKVVRANVHPIKLPQEESIPDVIARVQSMMKGTPPPWLRKIMLQAGGQADDTSFMDDDE